MKKLFTCAAIAAAALASVSAQAVVISYGGSSAAAGRGAGFQNDDSGLTSAKLDNLFGAGGRLDYSSGYFIETFDGATAMTGLPPGLPTGGPLPTGVSVANGCTFNSNGAVGITVNGAGFQSLKGSIPNQAASPANDNTCYGVSPTPGQQPPGLVSIDYTALLGFTGGTINYLGIYYGSTDTFNTLRFYNGNELIATVLGSTLGSGSGNQQSPDNNVYVNLDFGTSGFTRFEMLTTGIAVEVDNIVVGVSTRSEVPEPASLALLGAGLAGLGLVRRRKVKN